MEQIELTSSQTFVSMQFRHHLKKKYPKWKITMDNQQFFHINNGKRFIAFNFSDFKEHVCFLNIREDCDTRTAYNGFVQTLGQLEFLLENTW